MKNILVILALLATSTAHATKARQAALGGFGSFWVDTQTIFDYPQYVGNLGQYLTMEMGPTGTFATSPRAEGGFYKKSGDGILGVYFGHQDPIVDAVRNTNTLETQNNPFYLVYSHGDIGYGLNVSYADIKTTGAKEMTFGATFGSKVGDGNLGLAATAYSKSESGAANAKVFPVIKGSYNAPAGDNQFYGTVNYYRTDITGTTDNVYGAQLGLQNQSTKIGEGFFFYGAEISYAHASNNDAANLPIYAGIETGLFTWAQIRGSLSQSVIRMNKTTATNINQNNTAVNLGATVTHGNFSLDGLMAAGATGNVNGSSFLTSASLVYKF
ncbi:MAG: hypothetical protein JST80_02305 [Bdellovibrionales bacterium]|nr:hypothetical protein [Bdellovibrionales bacterium]